jgi:thioredoxin 1
LGDKKIQMFYGEKQGGETMEMIFKDETFETEVMGSDIPVFVDFYADWCGPCKMMIPVVEELAKELEGRVKVGKLNVDENPNTASKFRVMSIPTFILIKDGEMKMNVMGAMSKQELLEKIESALL